MSSLDEFQFAVMKVSGTISTFEIHFNSDDSNYFSYAADAAAVANGTAYTISSFTKSNWSATGSPDWSTITSIDFITTGTNVYIIDGIRVNHTDITNPMYQLVSHSALTTPIVKSLGSLMDIEYYLDY
jgi:hypothetical protein